MLEEITRQLKGLLRAALMKGQVHAGFDFLGGERAALFVLPS
jgi:hypothetical protein